MKIKKPRIVPEFYIDPTPRVLYVVRTTDGSLCNVNNLKAAADMLEEQCKEYIKLMKEF